MSINFKNKKFRPIFLSESALVSNDVIFHFKQSGTVLTCSYHGKNILSGHLIGIVEDNGKIDIRYHQINKKLELMTGTCISTPEILPNGKLRLHEEWQWTSGDRSHGVSILEEI